MILLPKEHPFRMYWDAAVWGNASRGTVSLFCLATVVQFGVGRFVSLVLSSPCIYVSSPLVAFYSQDLLQARLPHDAASPSSQEARLDPAPLYHLEELLLLRQHGEFATVLSLGSSTCLTRRSRCPSIQDLLVVLSTTTAYFASIAMMGIDIVTPRSTSGGMGMAMGGSEEAAAPTQEASVLSSHAHSGHKR